MVTSPFIPEMQQSQQNCSLPVFLLCNATAQNKNQQNLEYVIMYHAETRECRNVHCRTRDITVYQKVQFVFIILLQKLCPNFLIVNFAYYIMLDISDTLKL